MIKINLIVLGDIKEKYWTNAINEYTKRLSRFCNLKIIELKENVAKSSSPTDIEIALKKDAYEVLKHVKGYIVCLDINGKMCSSEELAHKIEKISLSNGEISFIIGASNGLSDLVKSKANERISFSPMTFPHQLMRVVFLEQLYRAFTIISHIAYHK